MQDIRAATRDRVITRIYFRAHTMGLSFLKSRAPDAGRPPREEPALPFGGYHGARPNELPDFALDDHRAILELVRRARERAGSAGARGAAAIPGLSPMTAARAMWPPAPALSASGVPSRGWPLVWVPRDAVEDVLDILHRLPDVYFAGTDRLLQVASEPIEGRLVLDDAAHGLRLRVEVRARGEDWHPVGEGATALLGTRPWLRSGARLTPVATTAPAELVARGLQEEVVIPPEDVPGFVAEFASRLERAEGVRLPERIRRRVRDDVEPVPVLRLWEAAEQGREGSEPVLAGALSFAYGDAEVRPALDVAELVTTGAHWVRRQAAAERAAAERLERCLRQARSGLRGEHPAPALAEDGTFRLSGAAALDFIHDHLPDLARDWRVYGQEDLRRMRVVRAPAHLRADVRSGIDWLAVDLELDYGEGRLPAAEVLRLFRSGKRWARLGDGRHLRLPEEWARRQARWLGSGRDPRSDAERPDAPGGAGDVRADAWDGSADAWDGSLDARDNSADVRDGTPVPQEESDPDPGLRFRLWDLALVADLLAGADDVAVDDAAERLLRLARDFRGIPEAPLPEGLSARLRPYQKHGFDWLCFLRDEGLNGILADEMGLGKTVQALALLQAEKERAAKAGDGTRREASRAGRPDDGAAALGDGTAPPAPSLVVVPTSLVFNWIDEARRFAPGLRVLPLVGPGRARRFDEIPRADLVLTTYALLRRDEAALRGVPFRYVILDEAQNIKNPASATARAAKRLRARHRLALTGTPFENNLVELWSLFDFLMPGFLGSLRAFRARYANGATLPMASDDAVAELRRRVHPFILRRVKEDVAGDLPPRTEATITCELTPTQRRLYQAVLGVARRRVFDALDRRGLARSRVTILDALLRLRQVCCHPALLGPEAWEGDAARTRDTAARGGSGAQAREGSGAQARGGRSGGAGEVAAKLPVFRDLVREIVGEGHKVLVFSQFVRMLTILRREMDALGIPYAYLDGRTRDRAGAVRAFQEEGGAPVFLISLKAGGTGLNLTAASYVIHMDPWWNPAVEDQATDRAHRIGQEKRVISYRIVTRGTVEEKILELQRRKRALFEGVLTADAGLGKSLTREDLEELLGSS